MQAIYIQNSHQHYYTTTSETQVYQTVSELIETHWYDPQYNIKPHTIFFVENPFDNIYNGSKYVSRTIVYFFGQ